MAKRLEQLSTSILATMSVEVPIRLAKLLLDFAGDPGPGPGEFVPLIFPLTHEAMAQIVGASRPHISTQLRELEAVDAVRRLKPPGPPCMPRSPERDSR